MTFVLVTGTTTGIGKTVTTAAMAASALRSGASVAVVKPVQAGVGDGAARDVDVVARLSGCGTTAELVRLDDPLAPDTAARLRGVQIPSVRELADRARAFGSASDLTLVEGSGGVLVRLDTDGGTILGLAERLSEVGVDVRVVVVTSLALGTLNHTELTVRAVRAAGCEAVGLVIGDLPPVLDLAERCNQDELPRVTGVPVLGAIPHGTGRLSQEEFRALAADWMPTDRLVPRR